MKWFKGTELGIQGRPHIYEGYNRFNDENKKIAKSINESLDFLVTNTAGLHIDFKTNSKVIKLRYELNNDDTMQHMAATGSNGFDLYVKIKDKYKYAFTLFPKVKEEELIFEVNEKTKKYLEDYNIYSLNFPLYQLVKEVELGIDDDAEIEPIIYKMKPIVFYGTSITQGGCASRPGNALTNIVRREFDREVYNIGFSGSGRLEKEMTDILVQYDPEIMVMDSLANMSCELIRENFPYFYKTFRKLHKDTPIIFVAQPIFFDYLNWGNNVNNETFEEFFETIKDDKNVYYLKYKNELEEEVVDGVHRNDLGFYNESLVMMKLFKKILK